MKEMGFQLVHSIYGKTEESVIGKAAQNMAPESTLSGSAVASACSVHRSSSNATGYDYG